MSDLTLAAAVDRRLAATALLELHLAGRLVQAVVLAGGVGASDELSGQLHVHPIIYSQSQSGHAHAVIEGVLDKEVDERTFTHLIKYFENFIQALPKVNQLSAHAIRSS